MQMRQHKTIKVAQITNTLFFGKPLPLWPGERSLAHDFRDAMRGKEPSLVTIDLKTCGTDAYPRAKFMEPRYSVAKKSTGEIVATDLELDAAEAMIAKAKAGKKAALVIA